MALPEVNADKLDRLAGFVKELAVVRGEVTLSSGRTADYYVDLRRITLDGQAAPLVGRVMLDLVQDWEFDAVGGLTLGADPVATAMLHATAAAGGESSQRRLRGSATPQTARPSTSADRSASRISGGSKRGRPAVPASSHSR